MDRLPQGTNGAIRFVDDILITGQDQMGTYSSSLKLISSINQEMTMQMQMDYFGYQ